MMPIAQSNAVSLARKPILATKAGQKKKIAPKYVISFKKVISIKSSLKESESHLLSYELFSIWQAIFRVAANHLSNLDALL